MRNKKLAQLRKYLESGTFIVALLAVGGGIVAPITALAQDKKDEITFDLVQDDVFERRGRQAIAGGDQGVFHRDRQGSLYCSNLLDKRAMYASHQTTWLPNQRIVSVSQPRTIGFDLKVTF